MSKVKICGLSRMEDLDAINNSLPDFSGFVFAESRRRVDEKTAIMLKSKLDMRIKTVGVFVNQDIDTITRLCQHGIIDLVQLHGDEDDEYRRRLRQSCGCPIIKTVCVDRCLPDIPDGIDYLLFDTASSRRGGTGKSFDWSLLKEYKGVPYFLAGGLDASNVQEAINLLHPFCVDVSSGVEMDGVKDSEKITAFTQMVRRLG